MDISDSDPAFVWIERDCSKGEYDDLAGGSDDASILPAVTIRITEERSSGAGERSQNFQRRRCVERFGRPRRPAFPIERIFQASRERLRVDR